MNLMKIDVQKVLLTLTLWAVAPLMALNGAPEPAGPGVSGSIHTYTVSRKVSDFPTNEDLSTPEAAYATVNRLWASGDLGFWKRDFRAISGGTNAGSKRGTRKLSQKVITEILNSEVLEVRIYSDRYAGVLANVPSPGKKTIDLRCFERVTGRWLNTGQSIFGNVDAARAKFTKIVTYREAERNQASRPPVANPRGAFETIRRVSQAGGD